MQWQKLTARSKPKAPCVLAWVRDDRSVFYWRLFDSDSYLKVVLSIKTFRRDYNRFLELPEVK